MLGDPEEYPLGKLEVPYRYRIREDEVRGGVKRDIAVEDGSLECRDLEQQVKRSKKNGASVSTPLPEHSLINSSSVSACTSNGTGNVATSSGNVNTITETLTHEDEALPLSPIASPGCSASYDDMELSMKVSQVGELEDANEISPISQLAMDVKMRLSPMSFNNMLFRLMSKLNRSELTDLCNIIKDNLKRDFITSLPLEISLNILSNLSYEDISSCLNVSKSWNKQIKSTPLIWKRMLIEENFVPKEQFGKYSAKLLERYPDKRTEEDCYHINFLENRRHLDNWYDPKFQPKRYTLPGHKTSVVTCLQFEDEYIITGADDKMIRVCDAKKKQFLFELAGHEGGVWALKYDENGIIVSGSTDRSVRIWDLKLGCCTHVFKGHTSTVRCLEIVEYKGFKYIISGSRDNTLHVWKLPVFDEFRRADKSIEANINLPYVYSTPDENPFFVGILRGHMASVRTVSGHGNIVISGSYDNSLMVWDIAQMKCLYVLTGHTDRIYSTIYDHKRSRCISASMDATIRVWDLKDIWKNGTCTRIMNSMTPCTNIIGSILILHGHTALVGLLKLSSKYLVSAAADGSLRGWNAENYRRKFLYHHINMSAITTFDVNDNLLVSGSESQFNIYNLRTGSMVHPNILSNADQIWSVSFRENILVVAVERDSQSSIEIFDFNERVPITNPEEHNEQSFANELQT